MELDLKGTSLLLTNTPLPGCTLPNLWRLLGENRFHISLRYLPRFAYSLALVCLIAPFHLRERLKYGKRIARTRITHDPVFIIGHWRCGTTLMHNLLSRDSRFGFCSTFQAYLPTVSLSAERLFKPLVASSLPRKRPMDDGDMDADLPQEDQYAMGAVSPYSYYHGWCFPRSMARYFDTVCLTGATAEAIAEWKRTYVTLLKKLTLAARGRRLLLKNQDNTGKIPLLLELFPDAKFIYLYRNPHDLYMSMTKFMRMVIPRYCLQTPPPGDKVELSMFRLFAQMTRKYLQDKAAIPAGNLAEVRYESFVADPLGTVRGLYDSLSLDGYAAAEPAFISYLATQRAIRTDRYVFTDPVLRKVDSHWGFASREYGYDRPGRHDASFDRRTLGTS